jgi:hypothetical protein
MSRNSQFLFTTDLPDVQPFRSCARQLLLLLHILWHLCATGNTAPLLFLLSRRLYNVVHSQQHLGSLRVSVVSVFQYRRRRFSVGDNPIGYVKQTWV